MKGSVLSHPPRLTLEEEEDDEKRSAFCRKRERETASTRLHLLQLFHLPLLEPSLRESLPLDYIELTLESCGLHTGKYRSTEDSSSELDQPRTC